MIGHYLLSILFCFGTVLITLHECTRIECHGEGTCSDSEIICKENEECVITCAGDHSCQNAHISCPQDHVCLIACTADDAAFESICEHLMVNATLSAYLSLQASANWNTLRASVIHCPYHGPCDLNADGRHVMTFMDVYAVQGFSDLNIQCQDCYLGDLYCTESFEHKCHMDPSINQCQPPCNSLYQQRNTGFDGQICNDYRRPTPKPTESPSDSPSVHPSAYPTAEPSVSPTMYPSAQPSATPTMDPSVQPSISPTMDPSVHPTAQPSVSPTMDPSVQPSVTPTMDPSVQPSVSPTMFPSTQPSIDPSAQPSVSPTMHPSAEPSIGPSVSPSIDPSVTPTIDPSSQPSLSPTMDPSLQPFISPTNIPSTNPLLGVSLSPSAESTLDPSVHPSVSPTQIPSTSPTIDPSANPSTSPTDSPSTPPVYPPSSSPTDTPSSNPSTPPTMDPSTPPSSPPSLPPGITRPPSSSSTIPSVSPSGNPSFSPTDETITLTAIAKSKIEVCDSNCHGGGVLFIELEFKLASNIMYNADNLDCYMYTILYDHLNIHFDFAQLFEVCDTSVETISGGYPVTQTCDDGYVPCFMHAPDTRRRVLLQAETTESFSDGRIDLSMVANDQDTLTILTGAKHTSMEQKIQSAFKRQFGLRMEVTIEEDLVGSFKADQLTETPVNTGFITAFSGTRDQWICVGTFLGVLAVLFPFEIYYTLKLYASRYEPFVHARHPILNTVINLTAAVFLVIERPMHAIHRLSVYNALWFQWTRLSFYFVAMQFLLGGVVLRFWLLLFEVKWTRSMSNKEWKKHIDINISTKTQSFWVRHHGTWGNIQFVWKYTVTICILLSAVPVFLAYANAEYFIGSMAHGVLLGSGVLVLYILWRTTPIFHDEFKIMEECGFVVTWIGVALLLDLIFTSLKIIFGETFLIWFLSFSIPFLLLSGIIFIQSYWVLSQMQTSKILHSAHAYQTQLNLHLEPPGSDLESSLVMETMSLYQILADKMGCYEFIAHLLKEFSFENILSVIEMTQYKQCFLKWKRKQEQPQPQQDDYKTEEDMDDEDDQNYDDDDRRYNEPLRSDSENSCGAQDLELYGESIIELPATLPQSTIVWDVPIDRVNIQDYRNAAALLFAKYIKQGSELELNISFKLRKETNKKFADLQTLDELQLYTFFDGILNAMMKLMQDSYSRFRMTKGFLKYEKSFLLRRKSSDKSQSGRPSRPSIKMRFKKKLSPHSST
eukprot:261104_1